MQLARFLNNVFKKDGFILEDANLKKYIIGTPESDKPIKVKLLDKKLTRSEIIEQIDIGGHGLLRASSKNYKHIVVLSDPQYYETFIELYNNNKIDKLRAAVFILTIIFIITIIGIIKFK